MAKPLWRFEEEREALRRRAIVAKYGEESGVGLLVASVGIGCWVYGVTF